MRSWTLESDDRWVRILNGVVLRVSFNPVTARWEWRVNDVLRGARPSLSNACAAANWYARHRVYAPATGDDTQPILRRFGVEVEVSGCRDSYGSRETARLICDALVQANIPAVNEIHNYNHRVPVSWAIRSDSTTGRCGCELVSPPLTDLEDVRRVCRALRAADATVSSGCGLHVHVDAHDATPEQVWLIRELYTRAGSALDQLFPVGRRYNRWCRNTSSQQACDQSVTGEIRYGYGDRYRKVNLTSFVKYGTVEFRQHQGTCNAAKITGWVTLLREHVEWCLAHPDYTAELQRSYTLEEYLDLINATPATRNWALRRRRQYTNSR